MSPYISLYLPIPPYISLHLGLRELQALQQSASRWAAAAVAEERAASRMQAGCRGLVGLG